MMLSQETKILIGIGLATVLLLIGGVFLISKNQPPAGLQSNKPVDTALLVRDNSHKTASGSAKVTMVEFSDFQCPACGQAYPILKKISQDYLGKVNFVYRNFPLSIHQNSFNAAMAAEAADQQGKFWEMHDKLFETQDEWSLSDKWQDIFIGYAKGLEINEDRFKQDLNNTALGEKIRADQADGNALQVNATPTIYINGEKMASPAYQTLKDKIDSLLSK